MGTDSMGPSAAAKQAAPSSTMAVIHKRARILIVITPELVISVGIPEYLFPASAREPFAVLHSGGYITTVTG